MGKDKERERRNGRACHWGDRGSLNNRGKFSKRSSTTPKGATQTYFQAGLVRKKRKRKTLSRFVETREYGRQRHPCKPSQFLFQSMVVVPLKCMKHRHETPSWNTVMKRHSPPTEQTTLLLLRTNPLFLFTLCILVCCLHQFITMYMCCVSVCV